MVGHVTAITAFVCGVHQNHYRQAVSVIFFYDVISLHFSPLKQANRFIYFLMCILRSTMAYLCPNMFNFDVVDFSECRSEEIISFLKLSVCQFMAKRNETQVTLLGRNSYHKGTS